MPWVAARNGKVDIVYYGSTATSQDDPTAVWNVFDSQISGSSLNVLQVSNTPNRVGASALKPVMGIPKTAPRRRQLAS